MSTVDKSIELYEMIIKRLEESGNAPFQLEAYKGSLECFRDCETMDEAMAKLAASPWYTAVGTAVMLDDMFARRKAALELGWDDVAAVYDAKINEVKADYLKAWDTSYQEIVKQLQAAHMREEEQKLEAEFKRIENRIGAKTGNSIDTKTENSIDMNSENSSGTKGGDPAGANTASQGAASKSPGLKALGTGITGLGGMSGVRESASNIGSGFVSLFGKRKNAKRAEDDAADNTAAASEDTTPAPADGDMAPKAEDTAPAAADGDMAAVSTEGDAAPASADIAADWEWAKAHKAEIKEIGRRELSRLRRGEARAVPPEDGSGKYHFDNIREEAF